MDTCLVDQVALSLEAWNLVASFLVNLVASFLVDHTLVDLVASCLVNLEASCLVDLVASYLAVGSTLVNLEPCLVAVDIHLAQRSPDLAACSPQHGAPQRPPRPR